MEEKKHAYAEVLRQLSTAELLDRYYRDSTMVKNILGHHVDAENVNEQQIMIDGVKMTPEDARNYLIMQLVERAGKKRR